MKGQEMLQTTPLTRLHNLHLPSHPLLPLRYRTRDRDDM